MSAQEWLNKKRTLEEQKNRINKVLSELKKITDKTNGLSDLLIGSENYFQDGGYNDGDTLDRGVLKNSADCLENAISVITSVISKYNAKIIELEKEIKICENNYNICLKKEQEENKL